MAVWMVIIQICWVGLALLHRRRDPGDGSVPVIPLVRPWQGLLLVIPRFLFFLRAPVLDRSRAPPWLDAESGARPPEALDDGVDGLAASVMGLGRGRVGPQLLSLVAFLVLTLMPPLVMALAFRGVTIGDPEAQPDAMAALGAFVVTAGALMSARLHTTFSPVWAAVYPVGALGVAGIWILGLVSGPAAGEAPRAEAEAAPAEEPAAPEAAREANPPTEAR